MGIKALLGLFRALLAFKRGLVFVLTHLHRPLAAVWTGIIRPLLVVSFRLSRRFRKFTRVTLEPTRERLATVFARKYAVQIAVVILSFLVMGNNIYAGEIRANLEVGGPRSILASLSENDMDELVIEEATDFERFMEVSYLGFRALSSSDYLASEKLIEDAEISTVGMAAVSAVPIVNAVRVMSESSVAEMVPARTRTKVVEHVVESGETIGAIAGAYGLKTDTVLLANNLGSRSIIRPGNSLKIPPVDGILYQTRRGDTLGSIANKYKSEVDEIMDANGITDATELQIGTELILPGGEQPPPPRPTVIASSWKDVITPPEDRDGGTALLWPSAARRITQYFRYRHVGLDIAGPTGTPIYAADDGTVLYSGWNSGGYGNMMIVDHGNGLYTRYAHATKNLVRVGDSVSRGDVIQLMGSTGRSTGPHLHFEVMRGSIYSRVNPLDYIK